MSVFWGSQVLGSVHNISAGRQLRPCPPCNCRPSLPGRLQISAASIGPGKDWEHYELTKNKRVKRVDMHVRRGDTVQVIAGNDKGKVGEVTTVLTKIGKIVVDGVNIKFRTKQPQSNEEKGEIIQTESPIHHSNVMLYSKEKQICSRIGHRKLDDGRKVRYLVKTGENID